MLEFVELAAVIAFAVTVTGWLIAGVIHLAEPSVR